MNTSAIWRLVSSFFNAPHVEAEVCPEPERRRSQEIYYIGMEECPQTGPSNCNEAVNKCFAATAKRAFPEFCGARGSKGVCRLPREYRGENIIPLFKLDPTSWSRSFVKKSGRLVEDRASAQKALEYIRDSLRCGLPVQMAVSYLHEKRHQKDGATNHHVLVNGWYEKANGTLVLKAIDPATKNAGKAEIEFVVDRETLRIEKKPDKKGARIHRRNSRHYLGTFIVRAPEQAEQACRAREEERQQWAADAQEKANTL